MEMLLTFVIAFAFSFVGTIPPGVINLTIIQLGLEHKINIAWRFALASALVEYPYAWIAIEFENLITASPFITQYFQLLTAIVMILLGVVNLWSAQKPSRLYQRFNESGFRRGLILGVLNPQALPFWIAITAYLKSQHWVSLSSPYTVQAYLLGVAMGALVLLMLLAFLAKKVVTQFQQNTILKKVPGYTLLILGIYALIQYLL
jgi:threonine/homoserine/homoserine lactone efflux protein